MRAIRDWRFVAVGFIVIPACIILLKLYKYNYSLENIIPHKGYKLTLTVNTFNQRPDSITIKTFAPLNGSKQSVSREQGISDSYSFSLTNENENRRIIWQSNKISGNNRMEYVAYIDAHHMKYIFDEKTVLNDYIPENVKPYLTESKAIQTNSAVIQKS